MNMKRLSILLTALVALFFVSCNGGKEKKSEETTETEAIEMTSTNESTLEYAGEYEGVLPCADCEGIKTILTIRDDSTYDLKREYLGKEDSSFEESGTYNIVNGDVIELVTPSSGNKTYYKILENAVALTADETGTLAEGELADLYILTKK